MIGADTERNTIVDLELVPNPALDAGAGAGIAEQYGIQNGPKVVPVRQCMLAYFLKRYQLEEPTMLKAPHRTPLQLRNRAMAVELIPPGMRVPLTDTDARAPQLIQRLLALRPSLSEQAILEEALEHLLGAIETTAGRK